MKLTWQRMTVRPKYRFATSQGGEDERGVIRVVYEHDGITGLGEITPSDLYGQTFEASEAVLADAAGSLPDDPFQLDAALDPLLERHDGQRAAIAGVDSALHDWIGKRLGIPVWRYLGLAPARRTTTFTIGVAGPDETRVKIREALADGYTALKVKVGVDADEQTLEVIRELFDGPLLLDANQGWTPEQAEERVRTLGRFRPAMIEQPLRAGEWRRMRALRELGVAPIFADESCERPADVVKLQGCVDGVNIKLSKCGGIREALRMITLARALGMQVMLGCFVSTSLAIAPALAIATLVDFADLDGHLLLGDEPYTGIARTGATLALADEPGLGIRER